MNNDSLSNNYIDIPMDTFNSHNTTKQDSLNHHNSHFMDVQSEQLDLDNDSIEYMPNDLDDSNIQGKNILEHFLDLPIRPSCYLISLSITKILSHNLIFIKTPIPPPFINNISLVIQL